MALNREKNDRRRTRKEKGGGFEEEEEEEEGGVVWCGGVRCGAVWCDVVWCGVVWCGRRICFDIDVFLFMSSPCVCPRVEGTSDARTWCLFSTTRGKAQGLDGLSWTCSFL